MPKTKVKKRNRDELLHDYPHVLVTNDPQGMVSLCHAFLDHLQTLNYSEQTVHKRMTNLYDLMEWLGERNVLRPSEVTKQMLQRYQKHLFYRRKLTGKRLSIKTQRDRLVSVRSWFKWLTKEDYLPSNPASELQSPRSEYRLPKAILSESEVEAILLNLDITTPLGLRDRAIIETLYNTGVRRSELISIRVGDIDKSYGSLFVRQGKGKKDRIIPIGERAIAWIDKYVHEARGDLCCGQDDGELFLTNNGLPFDASTLTQIVGRHVRKANLGKSGSCHIFRHSMATLMLDNGADIRFIQAMLGHAGLNSTEIYTHVSIKKLKAVHTETHPGALLKKKKMGQEEGENQLEATEDALWAMLESEGEEEHESRARKGES